MSFAENLKKCKEQRGITIAELAMESGVPVGTLGKLLSGVIAEPKLSTVLSLAKALGAPISALTGEGVTYVAETLTDEERTLVADYRRLDTHSRELLRLVMDKQLSLAAAVPVASHAAHENKAPRARILQGGDAFARRTQTAHSLRENELPLYELPVSAGVGIFLDSTRADVMTLPQGVPKGRADFAVRISGDSMEPKFKNGDILLVDSRTVPEVGELGIFTLDGEGYFKRYMGDTLRSLNASYEDIVLENYTDVRSCGKVVSRLSPKKPLH